MGRYMPKRKRSRRAMTERATEIDVRKVGPLNERGKNVGLGESDMSASSGRCKTRLLAVVPPPEDLYLQENSESCSTCVSVSSDRVSASYCSSNGSSELAKESTDFVDLEDKMNVGHHHLAVWRATARGDPTRLKLSSRWSQPQGRRNPKFRGSSPAEKIPSETELEDFFSAAEKSIQRQFTEKYNYDIAKDEPLEGRYEWVRVPSRRKRR